MSSTGTLPGVPWDDLHHAFGQASDLPALLTAVSKSGGRKLRRRMRELYDRVLHQGTIYSASPPAVRELIPMAARTATRDKALFYDLLTEFASSARQSVRDGRAIPCCSGGDPVHGAAILRQILEARDQFAPDLAHPEPAIRGYAGDLLCASADADPTAAQLVRGRFAVESHPEVRASLLNALTRVRARFTDWSEFLAASVERESDPAGRFALRHAQVKEMQAAAGDTVVRDLISSFLATTDGSLGGDYGRFFEAVVLLGPDRELAALLQTLAATANRQLVRMLAERLLRLAFHDQRTGWDDISSSIVGDGKERQSDNNITRIMVKVIFRLLFVSLLWTIFPFLLRRELRANEKRVRKIDYWGVKGDAPELPAPLTAGQQNALNGLAGKAEVWIDQTNLWSLFGLPDTAAGLRSFIAARA